MRLRRSDCSDPGLTRRRHGKGFQFLDEHGDPIDDDETLTRIRELVIPPAWRDVWICPVPTGHIQATGFDDRGRKQYLYHPRWRERRDQAKFDDMLAFARGLPALREEIDRELGRRPLDRNRVLAAAVRLLDRGFFRIGSEEYAAENRSYGLATMRKEHVVQRGDTIVFDFPAKSGKRRVQAIVDPEVAAVVRSLKRRRGGGEELLAYKVSSGWRDVHSEDINAWLRERAGREITAKDFRTWGATVLAAVALAVSGRASNSQTARKRAITRAVKEVAGYLGNTPAVARASYIDPRVIDRFHDGLTIGAGLERLGADPGDPAIQGAVEAAVLDLIEGHESSSVAGAAEALAA
ncbi:MAG TPA: DNA topoisomerase IB [Solirubrobacteraceae bacterium]|nr:DNA topoisomerase IB [Solirubrobacteraceae bacterium]